MMVRLTAACPRCLAPVSFDLESVEVRVGDVVVLTDGREVPLGLNVEGHGSAPHTCEAS